MTYSKPPASISELEQTWVDQWGEAVSKTTAAKMLGVSTTTIWRMVQDGRLIEAPNGRILVRPAARWANSKVNVLRRLRKKAQTEGRRATNV